jgi:hypothetical protein
VDLHHQQEPFFYRVRRSCCLGASPKGRKDRCGENRQRSERGAPAVSRDASVVEMTEDGSMKALRKGTGEWTCVPDDPSTPGNDPMCLDPNAMEWLHAYITKSPPPDKVEIEAVA